MKILVTGGTGFIGGHLVNALLADGHQICLLARRFPSAFSKAGVPDCQVILGDVLPSDLDGLIPDDIEVIYHVAAMSSVTQCIAEPGLCSQVNLIGAQNMLEVARKRHVQRFVLVSSVYVYGDTQQFPTPEETCLFPNNPLGASKAAAEHIARAYFICYGLPVIIFRPFTVYGPGSAQHQIIPSLIDQLLHASYISLGDPTATRDFIHVNDVVNGLCLALDYQQGFDVFNLGTGVETSIADLAGLLLDIANKPDKEIRFLEKSPRADERHGISRQCADITHAFSHLSWKPTVPLRDGLTALLELIHEREEKHV